MSSEPPTASLRWEVAGVVGAQTILGGLALFDLVAGPVRALVTVPILWFLPGYAIVSAAIPTDDGGVGGTLGIKRLRRPGLAWFERCALSFATSLAVLVFVALVLSSLSIPLSSSATILALWGVVVLCMGIGAIRRAGRPEESNYRVPVGRWRSEFASALGGRNVDRLLNLTLAVVVLVSTAAFAVGLSAPQRGESYTEIAVFPAEHDGAIVGNYSLSTVAGEPLNLTLSVENQEGAARNYTAAFVLDRVRITNGSVDVLQRSQLERVQVSLPNDAERQFPVTLRPSMVGSELRLSVQVFDGRQPTVGPDDRPDHTLYVWLEVRPATAATGGDVTGQA